MKLIFTLLMTLPMLSYAESSNQAKLINASGFNITEAYGNLSLKCQSIVASQNQAEARFIQLDVLNLAVSPGNPDDSREMTSASALCIFSASARLKQ